VLSAALAAPSFAFAQSDEQRAAARTLAGDGSRAFQEGRWKDCVDLFQRAESLVHAPPHLLFIARAEEKQGHLVRAREAYLRIVREHLADTAPQAFRNAQAAATEEIKPIEPRIGFLTVRVTGGDASAVTVTMDGETVPAALVGVSRPADPGDHKLEAKGTGFVAAPVSVHLAEGGRESVSLVLTPAPVEASSAVAGRGIEAHDVQNDAPKSDDSKKTLRIASYAALGVGVLGVAGGTIFALKSKSNRADADSLYAAQCNPGCDESDSAAKKVADLDDSARSAKTLAIVSFVVGGLGLGAGATLFVLSNKKSESEPASAGVTIQPVIGLGSAGVIGKF